MSFSDYTTFALTLVTLLGAGAAMRASLLRGQTQGWKDEAELRGMELGKVRVELAEVRHELLQVRREQRALKDEHERLRDKYIQSLEDSRHDLQALAEEVRLELRRLAG